MPPIRSADKLLCARARQSLCIFDPGYFCGLVERVWCWCGKRGYGGCEGGDQVGGEACFGGFLLLRCRVGCCRCCGHDVKHRSGIDLGFVGGIFVFFFFTLLGCFAGYRCLDVYWIERRACRGLPCREELYPALFSWMPNVLRCWGEF